MTHPSGLDDTQGERGWEGRGRRWNSNTGHEGGMLFLVFSLRSRSHGVALVRVGVGFAQSSCAVLALGQFIGTVVSGHQVIGGAKGHLQ